MQEYTVESVKERVDGILAQTVADTGHSLALSTNASELRNAVSTHWNDITNGKKGNCTRLAGLLARLEGGTLVHAYVSHNSKKEFHAWVEFGEVCADLTQQGRFQYCRKEDYPFEVIRQKAYRGEELLILPVKWGHWGPWDD